MKSLHLFRHLSALVLFSATLSHAAETSPLLRGGENVLFIGNSLTASLSETLNDMAEANKLPKFNGHRLQIWNQTFRTHVLINEKDYGENFDKNLVQNNLFGGGGIAAKLKKDGYRVSGHCSFWKQGQYNRPEFNDRGYITALEAIKMGTPEGKPWDLVVLQGYSDACDKGQVISRGADGKIEAQGTFMIYGSQLIEAAKSAGAKVVLYAPPTDNPTLAGGLGKEYIPRRYENAIASYKELGRVHDVPIIPVCSAAWTLVTDEKPDEVPLNWLHRDNVHPAACGTALVQYMIEGALYGVDPKALHYQYDSRGAQPTRIYHYIIGEKENVRGILITPEIDQKIKKVASDALTEYGWQLKGSQ